MHLFECMRGLVTGKSTDRSWTPTLWQFMALLPRGRNDNLPAQQDVNAPAPQPTLPMRIGNAM